MSIKAVQLVVKFWNPWGLLTMLFSLLTNPKSKSPPNTCSKRGKKLILGYRGGRHNAPRSPTEGEVPNRLGWKKGLEGLMGHSSAPAWLFPAKPGWKTQRGHHRRHQSGQSLAGEWIGGKVPNLSKDQSGEIGVRMWGREDVEPGSGALIAPLGLNTRLHHSDVIHNSK